MLPELLLGFALFMSPSTDDVSVLPAEDDVTRAAVFAWGVKFQVLDRDENGKYLDPLGDPDVPLTECQPLSFPEMVTAVRERREALAGKPFLGDTDLFPGYQVVCRMVSTGAAYRTWLTDYKRVCPAHRLLLVEQAIGETELCLKAWGCLQRAQTTTCYVCVRREALAELRDMLGEGAYYRGQMPPAIPYWHLPRWR